MGDVILHTQHLPVLTFQTEPISNISGILLLLFCFVFTFLQLAGRRLPSGGQALDWQLSSGLSNQKVPGKGADRKKQEHWVENSPGPWAWESCHISEVGFEEAEDEVNESQKTNGGGRLWGRQRSWERDIRNVGNIGGKTGIFCWGLHAENLPRLSPTLKKLVWLKEKLWRR